MAKKAEHCLECGGKGSFDDGEVKCLSCDGKGKVFASDKGYSARYNKLMK